MACSRLFWTGLGSCSTASVGHPAKRIVYLLQSDHDTGKHYVAVTSNLHQRLEAHNAGQNVHTSRDCAWHVLVSVEFRTEAAALKFERYVKSGSGRAFAKRHFP